MHADETKELIEREQKLMKNAVKQMAKLLKDYEKHKNYAEYLKNAKKAKRLI